MKKFKIIIVIGTTNKEETTTIQGEIMTGDTTGDKLKRAINDIEYWFYIKELKEIIEP